MKGKIIAILLIAILSFAIESAYAKEENINMKILSPEFKHNESIPKKFTCQGEDISPSLIIENVPKEAESLALIVDDPDTTTGTWVHWVVYDISPISLIKENSVPGKQGVNDSGDIGYTSPCPPSGTHRYYFKIYALDKILNLNEGITKIELEKAMAGHILEQAELIGLYQKTK